MTIRTPTRISPTLPATSLLMLAGLAACSSSSQMTSKPMMSEPFAGSTPAAHQSQQAPMTGAGSDMSSSSSTDAGSPALIVSTNSISNQSAMQPPTSGASPTFGTNPAPGATGPAPTTAIIPRRPGKLDPFWIEATAEADRALWAAADPMAATAQPDPRVVATGPLTSPTLSPMGEGAEGLTHVTFAAEGADFDPCVSADNSFMVFSSTQHRATADIYSKSISGRTITQLTSDPAHDIMPSISPDGRRIAFCSNRNGNWDVYVMSARGGQAVQLSSEPTQELHPSWSPDGTKIAFCRLGQMSARWELWVMDAANAQSAEFIGFGMFPQWSPKPATAMGGKDKILFQRSRERGGRAFSLWTIDYAPGDAGSPTEVASSTSAAFINANWSPDARHVVFASVDNPGAGPANSPGPLSELWMVNIDGTGLVNLTTSGRFMNLMPCWAADNRIYFVSDRSGVPNIWAIGTAKAVQAATGFPTGEAKTNFANVEEEQSTPSDR